MNIPKKRKNRLAKVGLPPGTLLLKNRVTRENVSLAMFRYNQSDIIHSTIEANYDLTELFNDKIVTWLNIDGIHNNKILERIGLLLKIHPLVLEDIQSADQRPKVEDYGSYFYLTMKMLRWDEENRSVTAEQISLIVGKTFVISFQEYPGNVFDSIRQRILYGTGRIRKEDASYLAYALLDTVVDQQFLVLERSMEHLRLQLKG